MISSRQWLPLPLYCYSITFQLLLCYSLLYFSVFSILFAKFCLHLFQLLMNCACPLDKKLYGTPESMKEQFPSDS